MSPRSASPAKPRRKKQAAAVESPAPVETEPAASQSDSGPGATPTPVSSNDVLIVGVGASAGGLEALSALLTGIQPNPRLAVVVVQHLSPTYRSMLPQLLARETSLVVDEVVNGVVPRGGHAYITPPNKNLVFDAGRLHLVDAAPQVSPKPSINAFFESLAEARGEDAVGVVLSGTGSDGARGVRAIKAGGGMTFAQDPEDAKYAGMPQAAVDTGSVDFVLTPDRIGEELTLLSKAPPVLGQGPRAEPPPATLKTLLARVRQHTKLDFSGYKEATLLRRIERRMIANRVHSLEDYVALVQNNAEEIHKLAKDILISVTSFFRDQRAFEDLRQIVQRIVERKRPGDEIRVWVPGCATGEEAYSIAILFHRVLGAAVDQYRLQVFATDVDSDAMAIARKGAYSGGSLTHVDPDTLKRFFGVREDRYEIVKALRDVVLFARQDLVLDPPFLRLDLVSCRNVLIYFQPALQSRVFALFHYALQPDGFLFLGKSESALQSDELFAPVDKDARIFRRLAVGRRLPMPSGRERALPEFPAPAAPQSASRRELDLLRSVCGLYLPPGVLINAQLAIQHVFGDIAGFARVPAGKPTQDLGMMIRRDFRVELQTLLRNAVAGDAAVRGRIRIARGAPAGSGERLAVHPVAGAASETLYFVCLEAVQDVREAVVEGGSAETVVRRKELEDELATTREHLQTLVEELETQNEEMQALNEEIQASNEELQASNEELEAANEELQSTNEELMTINQELSVKTGELTATNTDLESIQNAVGMPVLVVDAKLSIVRRNLLANQLLRLPPGLPVPGLSQLPLPEGLASLPALIDEVLRQGRATERDVVLADRHWQLRLLPYPDSTAASGVVITLYDQTDVLQSREAMRLHRERLLAVMNNSTALILLKDPAGRYEFVNARAAQFFGLDAAAMLGRTDEQLLSPAIADLLRDRDVAVLRSRAPIETEDELPFGDGPRTLLAIRFPLFAADGAVQSTCLQAADITDRKRQERQLRLSARVIEQAAEGVLVTDPALSIVMVNEACTRITGYARGELIGRSPRIFSSDLHDESFYRDMTAQIKEAGVWRGEILNRRKNGETYPQWLTISTVRDEAQQIQNYVSVFSDVTEYREARQRLEFLALHDDLTALPNRSLFADRGRNAIAKAERKGTRLAFLFLDLDNFKNINDSFGHRLGDQLLREVAVRLRGCLREQDTIARVGGDEFVVLVEEVADYDVNLLTLRIEGALGQPFALEGASTGATVSIGISFYPEDGRDLDTLLRHADSAMYKAKGLGRNNHQYFSADLKREIAERMKLDGALREAIGRGAFSLAFQPILELGSQHTYAFEALLRWRHPGMGDISPARFIPLAEEMGLIPRLTEWVFGEVCRHLTLWAPRVGRLPKVAINMSAVCFRDEVEFARLAEIVDRAELDPSLIELEITESVFLKNAGLAEKMLERLRLRGTTVSLDDFGIGYSSLSRLKSLPIDVLKIDRTFVDGVASESNDRSLCQAIIAIARALDIRVIAEGVENDSQREALRTMLSADGLAQGFLYSHPLPGEAVPGWIARFPVASRVASSALPPADAATANDA